jgi:hypothetical protein
MDARDFLHRVLPHSDGYFYGALVANGKFHQHRFNNIQALIRYADSCKKKQCDVYFATGSFTEKRTASDCRNKRALYPKKDAVRELFSFCDERFVRPNILVDSGGGIHAYWTFTHEISTESWLEMAEALKHLCEVYGLAADPTVTADAARILRIPGTYNIKEDTPRQVRVIHATTKEFKPKRLRKILGTVKSKSLSKLGALAQEMDLALSTLTRLAGRDKWNPSGWLNYHLWHMQLMVASTFILCRISIRDMTTAARKRSMLRGLLSKSRASMDRRFVKLWACISPRNASLVDSMDGSKVRLFWGARKMVLKYRFRTNKTTRQSTD